MVKYFILSLLLIYNLGFASIFIGVSYDGEFVRIDTELGQAVQVRTDLPPGLNSLAQAPNGKYYCDSYNEGFFEIDPYTGDTQYYTNLSDFADYPIRAMAFNSNNELFVCRVKSNHELGVIDLENSTFRKISNFTDTGGCQGLDFSPTGVLYGTALGKIFTIDTETGETFQVGNSNVPILTSVYSIAFTPDGRLFAFGSDYNNDNKEREYIFVEVDVSTGLAIPGTRIEAPDLDIRGIAYVVPEPLSIILMTAGGILIRKRIKV